MLNTTNREASLDLALLSFSNKMGAAFSLNRRELLHECSIWNFKARESVKSFHNKCPYPINENTGKENRTPVKSPCDCVAAYLQKCANVGKKKIKGKVEPAVATGKAKEDDRKDNSQNRQLKILQMSKAEGFRQRTSQNTRVPQPRTAISSFTFTTDALRCLGNFVKVCCENLTRLRATEVVLWLRGVDRALLLQGWQDQAFLTPPNLVFLFMLLKEYLSANISSAAQLRAEILTCLYMAYTYNGPEISYPLKPFLVDGNRVAFWDRCILITNNLSGKMLKVNMEPKYFAELLVELKNYGAIVDRRDG